MKDREPWRAAAATPRDPEPWQSSRRPPRERPRHERAESEDPDDTAETSAAIAAESWGEVIEVPAAGTVDGDFNGAPELAALEETRNWEGTDSLEGMQGRAAQAVRQSTSAAELLADALADRRQVLLDRLDEARELGLERVFENAAKATEPAAGSSPVVRDDDVLRDQLALIDTALELLERRSAEAQPERR